MYAFVVNYEKDRRRERGTRHHLVDVGFFAHDVPQLLLTCRLLGHRPVVDGTGVFKVDAERGRYGNPYRWVVCDRCGVRGEPQGHLDPAVWNVGDRYTGAWAEPLPAGRRERADRLFQLKDAGHYPPGRIPHRSAGEVGGQLVIGRPHGGVGVEVKVGNAGSEHTLAAVVHLWPLGALYLHTSGFGTWVQRRLNPVGYDSRIIGVGVVDGLLQWRLWALRDGPTGMNGKRRERWWMRADVNLRWRDRLFGRYRYRYTDVPGGSTTRMVRLPEDDYLVELTLKREVQGRDRWRKTGAWSVNWEVAGKPIPTAGPQRDRIYGSAVPVPEHAVRVGTWPDVAAVAIAAAMTKARTGREWSPTRLQPVDPATGAVAGPVPAAAGAEPGVPT